MTIHGVNAGPRSPARPTGGRSAVARVGVVLLGLAAIIVGIILLLNPVSAARSLALLVTLGLIVTGLLEITSSPYGRRWVGRLLGTLLIVGGLVAVFWPRLALWPLAVIVGVNLSIHGFLRALVAVVNRADVPRWGWLVFAGVLELAIGVAALAWPSATVLVLAVLLGAQILVFGVVALVVGLRPSPASTA